MGSREARGGGAQEEPKGLNKKSLYNSAMSKVSIITIYSDKNIISFHINTTKKTPKPVFCTVTIANRLKLAIYSYSSQVKYYR